MKQHEDHARHIEQKCWVDSQPLAANQEIVDVLESEQVATVGGPPL